jgi:hypothetical protein
MANHLLNESGSWPIAQFGPYSRRALLVSTSSRLFALRLEREREGREGRRLKDTIVCRLFLILFSRQSFLLSESFLLFIFFP